MLSAAVTARGADFEAATPKEVLRFGAIGLPHSGGDYQIYAVSADAQRIRMVRYVAGGAALGAVSATTPVVPGDMTVALHWEAGLKK